MDQESIVKHLDDVEQKVDLIIGAHLALREENFKLLAKIERIEKELQEKTEAAMQYTKERDLVCFRIDALLSRLGEQSKEALEE